MASGGDYRTPQLKSLDGLERNDLQFLVDKMVESRPSLANEFNATLYRIRQAAGMALDVSVQLDRDGLQKLLEEAVKANPLLAVEVNSRLDEVRKISGQRLKALIERQRAELLEKLELDYPNMKKALKEYGISTKHVPTWEQIKKGLTPDVLDKALKLGHPTLLLVAPTTRKSKFEAVAKMQFARCTTENFGNNDLWNGGKSENEKKWRVIIVGGGYGITNTDPDIHLLEKINAVINKYHEQGLDVMNDADTYLTSIMLAHYVSGCHLHNTNQLILNGKNLKNTTLACGISGGCYHGDWAECTCSVHLNTLDSENRLASYYLRGMLEVKVTN